MKHRKRIYIACPITKGDREANFSNAANAQRRLMEAGLAPLNPALTIRLPYAWELDHKLWLDCDFPWVRAADALLRLPGESAGADMEVAFAVQHGIAVYWNIDALIADKEAL